MAVPGTWNIAGINLPDFGLTEKAVNKNLLPNNSTFYNPQVPLSQGLSNIGMQSGFRGGQAGAGSAGGGGGAGNIVGGQFTPVAPQQGQAGWNDPNPGGMKGGNVNGVEYATGPEYLAAVEASRTNPEIDQAYGLFEGLIGGNEANIQEQYGVIDANKNTNLNALRQSTSASQTALGNRKTSEKTAGENAMDEAKRIASQVLQGIQSKYGGSTGEGSFASALFGGNTQRTIGGIRQTLQTNLKDIDDKIQQVGEVARIGEEQIQNYASEQTNQAKQWLQGKLGEIRANQATLLTHKADMAYQALQQYQQFLQSIELNKQNLANNLTLQRDKAAQYLQGQQQQLGILQNPQTQAYNAYNPSPMNAQQGGSQFIPGQSSVQLKSQLPEDYIKQLQQMQQQGLA